MEKVTNPACESCDYFEGCRKRLKTSPISTEYVLAKEQDKYEMPCQSIVQDICRDCKWFIQKKCASWKILNGKVFNRGNLENCPKKVKAW